MNFVVKPYDPIDDALQRFVQFNATPADQRDYTEDELLALVVHKIKSEARDE